MLRHDRKNEERRDEKKDRSDRSDRDRKRKHEVRQSAVLVSSASSDSQDHAICSKICLVCCKDL